MMGRNNMEIWSSMIGRELGGSDHMASSGISTGVLHWWDSTVARLMETSFHLPRTCEFWWPLGLFPRCGLQALFSFAKLSTLRAKFSYTLWVTRKEGWDHAGWKPCGRPYVKVKPSSLLSDSIDPTPDVTITPGYFGTWNHVPRDSYSHTE